MPDASFARLASELRRHGVQFDTEPLDQAEAARVLEELPLPPRLVALYDEAGPAPGSEVPWVVEDLSLYAFRGLPDAQEGYRWVGADRRAEPRWPQEWVVLATESANPFFVKLDEDDPAVYFAHHGEGDWAGWRQIAPSVLAFLEALEGFAAVLLGEFDGDVWDDEGLREDFVQALRARLTGVLPPDDVASFLAVLE